MFYLLTYLAAIPSPVLAYAEPWAIFVGLMGNHDWMLTGLAIAAGQTTGFSLAYFFGDRLVARFPRLQEALGRFDRDKLRRRAPWFLSLGSISGVPPHLVMCTLCPLMGVQFRALLLITALGRTIRFLVLTGTPAWFSRYIDLESLPGWLRALG